VALVIAIAEQFFPFRGMTAITAAGFLLWPLPPSIEAAVIREEMKECIREFIDRLPDNYKTITVPSELEDSTTKRSLKSSVSASIQSRFGCTAPATDSAKTWKPDAISIATAEMNLPVTESRSRGINGVS
jgi:hypothetical protein